MLEWLYPHSLITLGAYMANLQTEMPKAKLNEALLKIVVNVVEVLGYVGAMIATSEPDGSLPVRALYVDPKIATLDQINAWEERLSKLSGKKVSLTDPDIARVYIDERKYKGNLSVQAYKSGKPEIKGELIDLFTPIVPANRLTRPFVKNTIQRILNIDEVIAIPFRLEEDSSDGEILGNLFAAKQGKITEYEQGILKGFGYQAAVSIELERDRKKLIRVANRLTTAVQANLESESDVLQEIVVGVVEVLGYVGALAATYESDDSLPVRAFYVDPRIVTMDQINVWEERLSKLSGKEVSITNPDIARVYIHRAKDQSNLSVKAYKSGRPEVSNELIDLFVPVVPANKITRAFVKKTIQQLLKIDKIIAVPFFLPSDELNDTPTFIGNLFVAISKGQSSEQEEIDLLQAFGQQAALGIRNARLFKKAEDRRRVSEVFGKMAFSASKSIHEFKNHIGFVRGQIQLLAYIKDLPEESVVELVQSIPNVFKRLDTISNLLENLREPWQRVDFKLTSINTCLVYAKDKAIPVLDQTTTGIRVVEELADDLPQIETSPDMLIEAFSIIMKNAVEAMQKQYGKELGQLRIQSQLGTNASSIEIRIQDNGVGISKEHLNSIFELGWSTKMEEGGLGFGLFWTKDFIEGHGGQIEVESQLNQGTTFIIRIPTKKKSA